MFSDLPVQGIVLFQEFIQGLAALLLPFFTILETTPLANTTQNLLIQQGWGTMTTVADILLGLFVVVGTIQIMCGQMTGTMQMPLGQFLAKAVLTGVLIHLSKFFGEQLLNLNNLLCSVVHGNVQEFVTSFTHGNGLNSGQYVTVSLVLTVVFCIGFFRLIFQAIKRIVRFNVLFVLSGLAFLTSLHPYTAPIFTIWLRLYITTIFEQFLQYLTFSLGIEFVLSSKSTGLFGLVLAAAMVNMSAEVPSVISRMSTNEKGGGAGALFGAVVKASLLLR